MYHLHVLIVLKSGSLNLLEPSEPVQACHRDCFKFILLCLGSAFGLVLYTCTEFLWVNVAKIPHGMWRMS